MITIRHVLSKFYSHCEWTLTDADYNQLVWYEGNQEPKPTQAYLETLLTQMLAQEDE